jgi:hypothetical protein
VAAAIVGALTAPKAKALYRVGVDSKAAAVLRHLRRWHQGFHSAEDFWTVNRSQGERNHV